MLRTLSGDWAYVSFRHKSELLVTSSHNNKTSLCQFHQLVPYIKFVEWASFGLHISTLIICLSSPSTDTDKEKRHNSRSRKSVGTRRPPCSPVRLCYVILTLTVYLKAMKKGFQIHKREMIIKREPLSRLGCYYSKAWLLQTIGSYSYKIYILWRPLRSVHALSPYPLRSQSSVFAPIYWIDRPADLDHFI